MSESYFDQTKLPGGEDAVQSARDLAMQVLTSRLPNDIPGFPDTVVKCFVTDKLEIGVAGAPEGKIRCLDVRSRPGGSRVMIEDDAILIAKKGEYDTYLHDGNALSNDQRVSMSERATQLLGELGVHSGMEIPIS